jgi:hypothetical protein
MDINGNYDVNGTDGADERTSGFRPVTRLG